MSDIFPEKDFLVFDQKETITWTRPLSGLKCPVSNALRLSDLQKVAGESPVEKNEVTWIFPKTYQSFKSPIPGDWLLDSSDIRWTISEVENLYARNCWKCKAVNLLRHFSLTDTIDVYRPKWTLDKFGSPHPEYHLSRPGVPMKILPPALNALIEIHFADPELTLYYRDCLMTPTNQAFRVVEFTPASVWSEVSKVFCKEVA